MLKSVICGVVLGFLSAGVQAEDLLQVYRLALENDPQLRVAAAQRNSTSEVERQAFANFLPSLSGEAGYSDTSGDFALVNGAIGNIGQTQDQFRVTLSQPIYRQSNYTQIDSARSQIAQADADYEAAVDNLLLRSVEAYFAVLSAEDALRFAGAEEKANARQLEQAEQRYEVGLTAITDVHEARASHDRSRANVIVAQNSLDDTKEALRELTGSYITTLSVLQENYPLRPPEPNDLEAWVQRGIESSPTLQARQSAVDVAYHNIRTRRAEHYPRVDASVLFQDTTNDGDLGAFSTETQNFTSIGITLTVPIYQGGAVSSRSRQAVYDYDAALERLEQERRNVVRQTRNNFRAVVAGISQVEAFKQTVVSAQSALDATEAGFEVGTRTIVDVLLAQRQLFQAQRDYSQARHNFILDHFRLRTSVGLIEVGDLEVVNQVLRAKR